MPRRSPKTLSVARSNVSTSVKERSGGASSHGACGWPIAATTSVDERTVGRCSRWCSTSASGGRSTRRSRCSRLRGRGRAAGAPEKHARERLAHMLEFFETMSAGTSKSAGSPPPAVHPLRETRRQDPQVAEPDVLNPRRAARQWQPPPFSEVISVLTEISNIIDAPPPAAWVGCCTTGAAGLAAPAPRRSAFLLRPLGFALVPLQTHGCRPPRPPGHAPPGIGPAHPRRPRRRRRRCLPPRADQLRWGGRPHHLACPAAPSSIGCCKAPLPLRRDHRLWISTALPFCGPDVPAPRRRVCHDRRLLH